MGIRLGSWVVGLALPGLILRPAAAAEPPDFSVRHLTPVAVDKAPVIDGVLDDPCWKAASHVERFWFPTENRWETEPTEAWLCIDAGHLYAAFYCHDSRPETILSQQTQRNGSLERDDYVSLKVDANRRGVETYTFRVSPNGTQNDTIPNSGSGNVAWAGDWTGAAQRVVDGYTVEMAIPFTTLRYPSGQKEFGIGFGRNLEREEEGDFWPPMKDRYQTVYLAGYGPLSLRAPVSRPAILPYAIFRVDKKPTIQPGLDVKHVFPNDMTALFTLNPDFRNVEDVVDTIAYSDVPRYLGDSRQFFREGQRFLPGTTALNTRNIPGVVAGLKTFGQSGPHQFGGFGVLSNHHRVDGAFDYTYCFTPDITLGTGIVYTDDGGTKGDNAYRTNAVSSTHFSAYHPMGVAALSYSGAFHHSFTRGPLGEGNAWSAAISYGGDGLVGGSASYTFIDPTFHAQLGYVPENDRRGYNLSLYGGKRTQNHFIQSHSWDIGYADRHLEDRSLLQRSWSAGGSLRFANGMSTSLRLYNAHRPPNHDNTISGTVRWGLESLYDEGGLEATYGHRGGSHYLFLHLDQGWAPTEALRCRLSSEYTWRKYLDGVTATESRTQNIFTASYELGRYQSVNARFVERRGRMNLFLAWRNATASGRSYYVFFGDPNTERTEARVQFKVVWPL